MVFQADGGTAMSVTREAVEAGPATANAAWQKAAGRKQIAARLEHIPAMLKFDDALDEPICYDSARKLLCYRGFMCNASYVLLRRLSDNPEYITALEQLYQGSAIEETGSRSGLLWKIGTPLTLGLTAIGLWLWLR
jgi:hypothetical protein